MAAREGWATAVTGRWTSLLIVVAVAWLIAVPAAADALAIDRLIEDEQRWIEAGAHVVVVTGTDPADERTIDAGVCDRLAAHPGVLASFAARRSPVPGSFGHIPGGRASVIETTAGAAGFLGASAAGSNVALVTTALAERTGIMDGEPVVVRLDSAGATTRTTGVVDAAVVEAAVLGAEYDGAILLPTLLDSMAETCFVRTDATHLAAVRDALPTLLQHETRIAVAHPRLFEGEFTVDYTTVFHERPLRWAWIAAGAMAGLLWGLVQWFRRSQMAIYTTFGMPTHSRLVMQVTEWTVLAVAASLWGWTIGALGATALGASADVAVGRVAMHTALTVATATVSAVLIAVRPGGTLLNTLKDR